MRFVIFWHRPVEACCTLHNLARPGAPKKPADDSPTDGDKLVDALLRGDAHVSLHASR